MTKRIENLIPEHPKAIRARLRRIESDIGDSKSRDHTRKAHLSALHSGTARQSARRDLQDDGIGRIERRLELVGDGD